jgi:carbon-monoxide dehydrogenase large subunit
MSGTTIAPDSGTLAALRRPEERIDGPAKVTGAATYAADFTREGMLHAAFLVSPHAHARIVSIDTTAARAIPGVRAVLTGKDVRGVRFGRKLLDRPVLAWDRVMFVGDRVAAVAADTPEAAAAAVGAIDVEYEELEPILDLEAALAADAPVLHPERAEYVYLDGERPAVPHPNAQGRLTVERGAEDIEAVFRSAARVVERTYRTPRQHAAFLEPHATLVWVEEDGKVRIITTNKTPFSLRKQVSAAFGIPTDQIAVESGYIGGDFGGKGYSVDEFGCVLLARETGRPVRSVMGYAEELGQVNTRHAATMHVRTACDAEGNLIAHEARILYDGGAYAAAKPLPHLVLGGAIATLAGYRIPNVRIEALSVYTNSLPGGHVRMPGEVQALFAGESSLDELAREMGEDPLAFRLRNAVRQGEEGAAGEHFREARAVEVLTAAAEAIDWDRPRERGVGVGIAMGARHVGGGKLPLKLLLHPDGRIEVRTGLPDQGAGTWQVIRRTVAVTASVDESRVTVTRVPTDEAPFDPGVGGSRVTHLGSRAGEQLGIQLREWLEERLPRALPNATPDVSLVGDRWVDGATGTVVADFDSVVADLVRPDEVVELSTVFQPEAHGPGEGGDYDFAACAVEVAVDLESGAYTLRDAVMAVDVGTIINPVAHRGQLEGGFVFGLGAAVMEEVVVEGGAVTTLSLADLKIPSNGDVPPFRLVLLPTALGPGAFGAKMAGELTNGVVAPAIANAIADAAGVRIAELPLSAERVHRALRDRPE